MKFYFIFGDYFYVMLLKDLEFILLCCSEKKQAPHVAFFNPLGHMFLTIKVVLNEPLDGAVKSNFYLLHCLCKTISLLAKRESGDAGTPSCSNW